MRTSGGAVLAPITGARRIAHKGILMLVSISSPGVAVGFAVHVTGSLRQLDALP